MAAAERKSPPLTPPAAAKPPSDPIEYDYTSKIDAASINPKPEPPPGDGWRLAAMTYGNGKLHYAWARKVGT